jgi:hypothetical protein
MPLTLVTDGKDPLTAPARAYLERLGIPMHLVTRINVDSTHNRFQEVTVTLQVDTDLAANPNMVAVPLLGQTRDEWPRAMHRTCGHVHPPFTDCPPTEPAPGPDGDTRDWPTDTIPAVSHAPASCAACGTLIRWNDGFGTWQHAGPDLDHEAVPSS